MKLEIVATTAILFAIGLAASTNATTSAQVAEPLENKQCQTWNLLVADANDAQQQRQEQRQQRIEQRQERLQQLPPEVRQQLQEQQQQRQEQRQQRIEQRQEQLQQLPPEVRQQLQEQQQQRQEVRQERIEQWQQLPPDVRQERIEQWQQLPPDVRQERREDRQDARRQERREDRQDAWLPQEPWYYNLDSTTTYTAPVQTYVTPASGVNSIKVEMRSLSQEQATVVIENADARQELIFTPKRTRQTVYLAPGRYKLWFKNAQGSAWISGTLNLEKSDRVRIAFNEDKEFLQVSDDPQAWTEDRRVSRQTQVR